MLQIFNILRNLRRLAGDPYTKSMSSALNKTALTCPISWDDVRGILLTRICFLTEYPIELLSSELFIPEPDKMTD